MLREKHRRDDLVVFGCILGNRWGGVVMRALLVDGRHISGVVYVGLGIVICGWGLWGCRSVGSSGNAQLQSQPEVGRGHRIEVLAKNCQYTHNDVEIRGYCHPKTSQCDKNQDIGAVSILECSRAKISGMDLSGRNLRYANFTESDLNGVKLNNSDLLGAHGEWATFQGVLADGADFSHAKLIGTEFRFAVLDKSLFLGAELLKARFDGAKLNDVDYIVIDERLLNKWEDYTNLLSMDNSSKDVELIYEDDSKKLLKIFKLKK